MSTSNPRDQPLGRGDGGPGVYIVALIDHSISFTKKVCGLQRYTEFRREEGIQLSLDDFWEVVNNPNHIRCNDEIVTDVLHIFEELKNYI